MGAKKGGKFVSTSENRLLILKTKHKTCYRCYILKRQIFNIVRWHFGSRCFAPLRNHKNLRNHENLSSFSMRFVPPSQDIVAFSNCLMLAQFFFSSMETGICVFNDTPSAMSSDRPISLEGHSGHILDVEMLQTAAVP